MDARPARKRGAGSSEDVTPRNVRKKTRFVEPSEDPVNFAEEVDAQLETRQRRGQVKTEGYESDSSDDGEDVVPSRRPGGDGALEDEDEDMFAIAEKEEKKAEQSGKKEEKFLRLVDIEGQEFDEGSDREKEEASEEEELEDEDVAERRKKAGMGYELSSFNMREEMEEGKFAADGTYVRTFDPHAAHDRWMEGLDEKEIKKARQNHRQREREQREKQKAEERELQQLGSKEDMEKELVGMLKKGETVLEALQRLGTQARKNGTQKKRYPSKKRKDDLETDTMQVDKTPKALSGIDHITHLASMLMSLGDIDIYSRTYEELVRAVRSSGKVDPEWVPPSADVKYEYKWAVPNTSGPDGQVFGPFSEDEVQAWYKAGYFGTSGENVMVKKVGGEWGSWTDVVT
ncbi:uncharacterized protein LAESUDRAFT_646839 [Laetiporus sulphureus 93-53]|uniref:GYF domain-containing protein n=1 Tax=Laetiporus sulphureus 93-53 TaxID=1314785 RepID=A0A165FWZ6_9APHY|nr:uncharacterized protein LAESUDRAFT_646839 [Laetiporus sulphureus 93-53]KZT09523.1 hypothetical protein LAESUDRAFT_646839 [Laetiporus sulphureus 93-53]